MKKANGLIVAAAFIAPLAFADNPNANQRGSMTRAFQAVSTTNNPTAPGIDNAKGRLIDNARKHFDNGPGGHAGGNAGNVERLDRVERPQHVSRVDRPDVQRGVDRPDPAGGGVDRPGRGLGRPDVLPGRGRGR